MAMFNTNNEALKNLLAARTGAADLELKKKELEQNRKQNVFGNVLNTVDSIAGIAKAGFDVYDKLKLQPEEAKLKREHDLALEDKRQTFESLENKKGRTHESEMAAEARVWQSEEKRLERVQEWGLTSFREGKLDSRLQVEFINDITKMREQGFIDDDLLKSKYGLDTKFMKDEYVEKTKLAEKESALRVSEITLKNVLDRSNIEYQAEVEGAMQSRAHQYAIALASHNSKLNFDSAMQIATEQAFLDMAREMAVQDAKTENEKEIIGLEYKNAVEMLTKKYDIDVKFLGEQSKENEKLEKLRNRLGIKRDKEAITNQKNADIDIIKENFKNSKEFAALDEAKQERIIMATELSQRRVDKAKHELDLVEIAVRAGYTDTAEAQTFKREEEAAKTAQARLLAQLEVEYGLKFMLQDAAAADRLEEQRREIEAKDRWEKAGNTAMLDAAKINAQADVDALSVRGKVESVGKLTDVYGRASDAADYIIEQSSNILTNSGITPTPEKIRQQAQLMVLKDIELFSTYKTPEYNQLIANARAASDIIDKTLGAPVKAEQAPKPVHPVAEGSKSGLSSDQEALGMGGLSFQAPIGDGAKGLFGYKWKKR